MRRKQPRECRDSTENIENDNVNTKEPTGVVLLIKINDTVNDVKKQCTKSLLPFLTKIESVTANARRRKVLKDGTRMYDQRIVLSKKHYHVTSHLVITVALCNT